MNIPVNMTTEELDLCAECKTLVYRHATGLLDILTTGPWYADTEAMHVHQPTRATSAEFDDGYMTARRSFDMVEVIPEPANDFERGWNAYANEPAE